MGIWIFFALYGGPVELIKKMTRRFWHALFQVVFGLQSKTGHGNRIILLANQIKDDDRRELDRRCAFYLSPGNPTVFAEKPVVNLSTIFSSNPIMVFGNRTSFVDWLITNRPATFDVDYRVNPVDGWDWIRLANYLSHDTVNFQVAHQRLIKRLQVLKREAKLRSYVFGTGPSLEKAMERQWDDGYRIVCNTIVRDPELWDHLKPDFIVAGDAIYHFGHTAFARAFREDLRLRLKSSDTLFLYPAQFHVVVEREFEELQEKLVPVPSGWIRKVNIDLASTFRLPNLGNVLGLLLLPLACTLSKHIFLWGFDGRAPADKLFWSNSNKHTYPEYMDELRMAHPQFFDHYVPASDPSKYVRNFQGEQLELVLQIAERAGWTFKMLHRSWTPTLQRRFLGGNSNGF